MSLKPQSKAPLPEFLSVIIPARDESGCVAETLNEVHTVLKQHQIPHELMVVDDGSTDGTWEILEGLAKENPHISPLRNTGEHGYGRAVIEGLNESKGDAVVIMMADKSDSPEDLVVYWHRLREGWDCVFGSRFISGGTTHDYPKIKLLINRLANTFIRVLFRIDTNDTTNAFKTYSREVIDGCRPFLSPHFNLTVEIPLKAMIRGYSYTVVPISWRNRTTGTAKLKIREMGSRYLFIVLYCWLEKYFSRGDYKRTVDETEVK